MLPLIQHFLDYVLPRLPVVLIGLRSCYDTPTSRLYSISSSANDQILKQLIMERCIFSLDALDFRRRIYYETRKNQQRLQPTQ
jgi:hypothetical protein